MGRHSFPEFNHKTGVTVYLVFLTALGVGGATVVGSLIGFLFKNISHKFSDFTLSLASGIMLAASVLGLVLPSLEYGGRFGILYAVGGIFSGALTISLIDRAVPHFHRIIVRDAKGKDVDRVLLFVAAIAIHNLPEGIAAGVGFGSGEVLDALLIAGGIALQNLPEGMVIISPMLAAGIPPAKTLLIAIFTGVIEIVGTFIGYFAVRISVAVLPFVLAFAGGTMLFVISDEMIPETHSDGNESGATYALLLGFCIMLALDFILG